jgi:hypothetical protein
MMQIENVVDAALRRNHFMSVPQAVSLYMRMAPSNSANSTGLVRAAKRERLTVEALLSKIFAGYAAPYNGPCSGVPLAKWALGEMVSEWLTYTAHSAHC